MSEAEFERERAQLFQKLGIRYDPESLSYSDNGPSTLQVKTVLKRITTAPPGVGASLPAVVPAPAQSLSRKVSAPADVTKSQIPMPAVREQTPEARQRATSTSSTFSNSVPAVGLAVNATCFDEREENSSCTPEANSRASSSNRKLSSQTTNGESSIVANGTVSKQFPPHEPHQGTGKDGHKPSLLSVPKVKSLKPPSSVVDPPAVASPLNKSVSVVAALPVTKRPAEAQQKANLPEQSVPEQGSRVDEGNTKRSLIPTGIKPSSMIKPPSKPSDVGTATPNQGNEKTPVKCDSVGSVQRPVAKQLSSEHSNGSLPVAQPKLDKLVDVTNGQTPNQTKAKSPNNLTISTETQIPNDLHAPLGTDGINFGNCTHCGLAVVGMNQGCMVLESLYHTGCFSCSKCGQGLENKVFYATSRNEVMCEMDYFSNLPKCIKCLLHIENRVVHAGGGAYHPGCFRCVVCCKEMEKMPYATDDAHHIYCEKDYHLKFSPKCSKCGDPIIPQLGKAKSMRVKAMGKYFHLECYKCEDCDVELARIGSIEKRCYPMDDHLFCKDCCKRRLMEAMALWDTSSPVPHVKITPSPSPSPIPPPLAEETVQ